MVPVHLAAARAAQRHVLKRLRSDDAVSPRSARPLDGLSGREERQLARLVELGMVRQASALFIGISLWVIRKRDL